MAAAHEVTPQAVKEIFLEACELTPDQRGAFLDARCGSDEQQRASVQALLDAHDRAGEFLAGPTLGHKLTEPGKGCDAKAARWKELLAATRPTAATTQFTSERK